MRLFGTATSLVIVAVTFLTLPALAATRGEIIGQDGTPMALVTAGRFTFGDSSYNNAERRIDLGAFYMDKFEVTLTRYAKFLRATSREYPFTLTATDLLLHGDRPVVNVDWHDAQAYCHWAGKYLPNEAQWEKAARGTDGRMYPWGNDLPSRSLASFDWDGKRTWQGYSTLSLVGSYEKGKSPYEIYAWQGTSGNG
jgi:formylglycine-generating enzyme required for sulfatase activity